MAMTTTPPVTDVCSGTSSLLTTVTMPPSLMGLPMTSGQHDVVLPPPLTLRDSGCVVGPATVPQQQPQSQMPLQAYANYVMGSQQVGCLSELSLPLFFICVGVCSGVCFLLSYAMLDAVFTMEAQPFRFATLQPFGVYPWQAYVQPGDGQQPTPGMHQMTAPSTALSRGEPSATQSAVLQPFQLYGGAYNFGGLAERYPIPLPSLHGGGSSFPGLVHQMTQLNLQLALNLVILVW